MKFGLIVFKNTENIGDDIQSYAAKRYLDKIDYFIEREELDSFYTENDEIVTTIMNGWYIHNKFRFPPSNYINPLYISNHLTPSLGATYLDGLGKKYLDRFAPIGARDSITKKLLEERGIENYFSGCLTLTLNTIGEVSKNEEIIAVDLDKKSEELLIENYGNRVRFITHKLNGLENSEIEYETRMNNVEKLLIQYQNAKIVVTSRLHCALPCVALGTPVLLIYDDNDEDVVNRLSDFLPLLEYCSREEFLAGNYNFSFNNPKAKTEHLELRKKLINSCEKFIKESKEKDNHNIVFKSDKDYMDEIIWKSKIIKQVMEEKDNYITGLLDYVEEFKYELNLSEKRNEDSCAKIQELESLNKILLNDSNKLRNLENRKFYKLYRALFRK